jgi:lipoate-protein ligase B
MFDLIVPCGIAGRRAVSLEALLGRNVNMTDARRELVTAFGEVFGCAMQPVGREALESEMEDRHSFAVIPVAAGSGSGERRENT